MNKPSIGVLASLASASMYGVNIVYGRVAAQGGLSGPDIILHRTLAMALLLAVLMLLLRRSFTLIGGERGTVMALALLTALLGIFYFSAVMFVPVSVAAIIFYTFPLFIMLIAAVVDGEKLTPLRLVVFALCFGGLVIAVGPHLGGLDWRGLVLAFGAALSAAGQFTLAGRAGASDTVKTLFFVHIFMLPIVFGVVLLIGGPAPLALVEANWFADLMVAVLYIGGLAMMFVAMKYIPPSLSGLIFYLEPVVAVIAAALILGEAPSLNQYIGGGMVLATLVAFGLHDALRKPAT